MLALALALALGKAFNSPIKTSPTLHAVMIYQVCGLDKKNHSRCSTVVFLGKASFAKIEQFKLRTMRLAVLVDLTPSGRSVSPLDIVVILRLAVKSGLVVIGIEVRIGLRHDVYVPSIHPPRIAVIGIVIISQAIFSRCDGKGHIRNAVKMDGVVSHYAPH